MKSDHVVTSWALASAGYRHLVLQCLRPCGAAGACSAARGSQPSTAAPGGGTGWRTVRNPAAASSGPNGERRNRTWPRRAGPAGGRRARTAKCGGSPTSGEIPGTAMAHSRRQAAEPPVVAPGDAPGAPPADAIVLFDGKDLSKWVHRVKDTVTDAQWLVHDGIFESGKGSSLSTRESFGDIQLHLEFATPTKVEGSSQGRGNSGVRFMEPLRDPGARLVHTTGTYAGMAWPPLHFTATRRRW